VVEVSAGDGHSCARLADGTVRCWGAFGGAWPGHPRVHGALRPLAVALPFAAVGLVSSGAYACARSSDGRQLCWGGDRGADADGGTDARETIEVDAEVPAGATANLDCVRDDRGRVRCGAHFDDRGGGVIVARDEGEVVGGDPTAVGSGGWHRCVARGDEVTCARRAATPPREGDPETPGDVRLRRPARSLTAGRGFSCALTDDGAAWCWGVNERGQLGTGVPGVVTIDAPTVVVR
jgi:alpha-tubulin suppressor-like RCC1 family protein